MSALFAELETECKAPRSTTETEMKLVSNLVYGALNLELPNTIVFRLIYGRKCIQRIRTKAVYNGPVNQTKKSQI